MSLRAHRLALVVVSSLALCGCSAATNREATPPSAEGVIELAVSETCIEGSDPQCTAVGGDHVIVPSEFKRAAVEDAVVSDSQEQNAVDVTFTSEGAAVVNELTSRAAQTGGESRLLFKIGEEVRAAVVVMEPLDGDRVTIALSPEEDPLEVVDLIRGT
ncbi:hypothetical protein K0817_018110 [Microbacterium sp. HD4P20]|uniref:hypothetical protein n=1 Tax=Microbacterium sp. HD4P20 TaxID=2864874 RepID=UPI0020A31DE8|nr:hypothetical protein [Microbacterium sp. HD4P20]MCP2638472.1 hypothetical protein [Microbacterium sp. HD4P20]